MKFNQSNTALTVNKGDNVSIVEMPILPKAISKEMHKNGKILYSNEPVELLSVPTPTGMVIIKFVDDEVEDDTKITMIFDNNDKTAVFWSELADGFADMNTSNIHSITAKANTELFLAFEYMTLAVENQETLLFELDDIINGETVGLVSSALEMERR